MNKHFVDSNGNYYECTDPIETLEGHKVITAKPSEFHDWDNTGEVWVDNSPTQEELDVALAAEVRKVRNAALAATDFMGLSDYPAKAGELEYRQALRDVPQQAGFPQTHTRPNKP